MLSILGGILLFYLSIVIIIYLAQTKMLFFPNKILSGKSVIEKYSDNEITIAHDNIILHGWHIRPEKQKTIFYYGGNAEEVSLNLEDFEVFEDHSIILINYRGYGESQGSPGQEEIYSDAIFIYDYFREKYPQTMNEVVLMGRSLGSGVATYVASQRETTRIILITPYDSILNIARKHFPYLPVSLILKHPFNSQEYAQGIEGPVLILIAENDNIIPYENTMNLIENFSCNVNSVVIKNTDHNTIQLSPEYWASISNFMKM